MEIISRQRWTKRRTKANETNIHADAEELSQTRCANTDEIVRVVDQLIDFVFVDLGDLG